MSKILRDPISLYYGENSYKDSEWFVRIPWRDIIEQATASNDMQRY